jgi:transcriptional regulator with XRE-family HTH domain
MVTLAQRIAQLRDELGLSRPALAEALKLPKNSIEKFETGRQSPTKEQMQLLADYFGVSLFYLRGESNDRTRQEDWMAEAMDDQNRGHVPIQPKKPKPAPQQPSGGGDTVLNSFLKSKAFQDMVRETVKEVLRSPEGQDLIAKAVRRELSK